MSRLSNVIFIGLLAVMSLEVYSAPSGKIPPAFVESQVVKFSSRSEQINATGTLVSVPGIIVRPEISGRVTKIYFKSGQDVTAGTQLIEVNSDIVRAQLAQHQATLKLCNLAFDRAVKLFKTHTIAQSELDKARADLTVARAEVDCSEAQLRQSVIVAPFSGRLGLNLVNVGDYVNAGQDMVSLQMLDPISVKFSIPEVYLSKLVVGQDISLRSEAYPQEAFKGKIEAFESLINSENRSLMVRASVPNKDNKLLPGGFVEVSVFMREQKNVIMVPQVAVVFSAQGNYVYKIVDGKAEKAVVSLGERDAQDVVVLSGLTPGDVIVTAGQLKVREGGPVMMAPPAQQAAAQPQAAPQSPQQQPQAQQTH